MIPVVPKQPMPIALKLLLGLSALAPFAIGGLMFHGYMVTTRKAPRHALHGRVVKTKLKQGWVKCGFPDLSLSMELPASPVSGEMAGGAPLAGRISSWSAYECPLPVGTLNIEGLAYVDDWKWELDDLEAETVDSLQGPERKGLRTTTQRVTIDGSVAVLAVSDFTFKKEPWRQNSLCCFGSGWQIWLTYVTPKSDPRTPATWARMLRTIRIGPVDPAPGVHD
jgi:hypothetical protein